MSASANTPISYRNLGSTGTRITPLCLGMMTYGSKKWREWVLEEDEARPLVRRAVEAGINFYDTADVYSLGESEVVTGKLLQEFQPRREELVIATKVFNPLSDGANDRGLSRKHIMASIDASLKRLKVDYVDLYQIHRFDPHTPIEETCEALHDVVKAGKALYLGASSMYAWQFLKMLNFQRENSLAQFVTMQNHYNLVYREEEREMIPLCLDQKVGCIPWSPLARGFLTGSRKRGDGKSETTRARTDDFGHSLYYRETDFDVVDRVIEIAQQRNVKPAQIALAWILAKPGISAPIIGASKPYQLEDALGALSLKLTEEEIKQLEAPYEPHPILGHSY
ncbi:aldo/keto reductase [Granulicella mallensis]|uniref:Aryl-alcohol dehydrogenase (NADP(+)) n=1 Tax=Granulicella mallensis (strain ATCC BAA-1857 / DSM 23137 / MP5ACTX8) TaxID=682795 RepID=G8NXK2_GRAMM|nr:aldo/keto reductase [Granulicella mallensis]AEU38997.1 Aryl-alcohol dehydrogenase (NADP(+)) [Granulicella mallensis MP5ACTX8]